MFGACPTPREECPYFERPTPRPLKGTQEHGCRSDEDHIIPLRLGATALEFMYLNLPDNLQQICRWEHEQRNAEHARGVVDYDELPSKQEMIRAVAKFVMENDIYVSKAKARKIFGEIWRGDGRVAEA